MDNNQFKIMLLAAIDMAKSKRQINDDIKILEKSVNQLRLTASLYKDESKKQINTVISELENKVKSIKLQAKFDGKQAEKEVNNALKNVSISDIKISEHGIKLKAQKIFNDIKSVVSKNPIPINLEIKKETLQNKLTAFLAKNNKVKESSVLLNEADELRNIFSSIDSKDSMKYATDKFQLFKSEVIATGYATKSTTDKVSGLINKITRIGSIFGVASVGIGKYKESITTLKEMSTTLTEISKTSSMVDSELKKLGDDSFQVASKYGQVASNYLSGVREIARSGYDSLSKELGELSVLAQSAGDMTAEMANNYLLATDAAYQYKGSVEKLTSALDGANYISNHNSATLTDIAEATRVSASYAAQSGVEIDQLTAAESTMIAVTKRSGSEMGRAFRSILLNIQQVSGEFDDEIIDEDQLKKVEARCHSLGVELETLGKNGAELRNPMEVLRELSEVYNSLPDNSVDKQGLISDLGGKYHANALSALLSRWDLYEKMLSEFSEGTGSALAEAQKTADSWEGRLNALQNTWDSFVNSITNQDYIKGGISFLDNMIHGFQKLTDSIGAIPILLTTVNASLSALNKDYGITQILNPETKKLDLQGNLMGIDITSIKAQKKHFEEAASAVVKWNGELITGQTNIDDFGEAIVKNNAQFKTYLSTCSKDAPASLEGYKAHLRASGVETDALRLKTVLLSSAISFGIGAAVQLAIAGFVKLRQSQEEFQNSAKELGQTLNSEKESIDDYKQKINDLHKVLNDDSSSYQEVANARINLMRMQDELIEKFGKEKEVIQIITSAINEQADALDNLSTKQYYKTKNQFNEKSGADSFTDWLSFGSIDDERVVSNMDKMVQQMENGFYRLKKTGNDTLDSLIQTAYGLGTIDDDFYLSGNLDKISETLYGIQEMSNNFDVSAKFENSFTKISNEVDTALTSYKDLYDQYMLFDVILSDSPDNIYAEKFNSINRAKEEYDKAYATGNQTAINQASENFSTVLKDAMDLALSNYDKGVAEYFNNMYPVLQQEVSSWNFSLNFAPNTDGLKDKIVSALSGLEGFSTEDIINFNPNVATDEQTNAFAVLNGIATEYGLTLENLISLLEREKLISSEAFQLLEDKFGDKINTLSNDDLEIAYKVSNDTIESWDVLIERIERYKEELNKEDTAVSLSVSDTINQLNTQLKPSFDSLKSAYQDIFTDDGFTLENVDLDMLEKIRSSFEGMEKLGLDIDYSSIDGLAKVLTDSSSTAEQVQQAFNEMAASIISNLSGISEENYAVTEAMLGTLGIVDSQIVAFNALISNTEVLTRITDEEAEAFVNEHVAAEYAGQALALLQLKKLLVNGTDVNTSNDIGQIMSLASAAGMGADMLIKLANAKSVLATVEAGGFVDGQKIAQAIADLKSSQEEINAWKPATIEFNGNSGVKSAGAAGKAAADAYIDAFEKELSNLKSLRDRGKITEKQYLDHLRKLYEVYFKNKKKYLDQYQKYEAEYLNGMKSLYESAFSGIISILDKQIAANNKQKDAAIDSLNEQKEAAEESYKAQQKLLDEQIDAIQKQIDIKQKEIDAINDAAEARKKEIELQKAQYELERAKNQRTKYVYKDGGGGYEIDSSAVTDARQNLDDTTRESNISKIEKEISLLEDKIDVLEEQKSAIDTMIESSNAYYDSLIKQSENYWDSIINGLEDYKSRWEELAELEEQAKMAAVLEQLGISTEDILGMSESAFQDFKNNYLNILADMYSGNDQMTKSLSELANVNMGSLNGHLAETQGHIDELRDIDFKNITDSIGTMSDRFGEVSESVGNVASAISGSGGGGGSKSSSDSGGSGGKSEPTEGASSSSLKSAVEEQVTGATEQLTKEAELFKGENGIKGAVQEVIDKIGGGDDDKGEDSDTITSAIKNQAETANKLLPKEQVLFKDLRDVIGQSKDHLSEIKTMLEDMNGKEFTVTLNVNGGGGGGLPNLPGHANGVKKIGKDETAWTQEAGREMIISPSTGAVLTPLSQGDSVLKNAFTENIFEWAKISPSKLIESFKLNDSLSYIPESKPQTVHVKQNVNITAPYLTNDGGYNRLVNELQGLSTQAYQYAMKK